MLASQLMTLRHQAKVCAADVFGSSITSYAQTLLMIRKMKLKLKVIIAILLAGLLVFAYVELNEPEESTYKPVNKGLTQVQAVLKVQRFLDYLGSELESDADNDHPWTKGFPALRSRLDAFSHELNLYGRRLESVKSVETKLTDCKLTTMAKGYFLTCTKASIFHTVDSQGGLDEMGVGENLMKFNFDIGGELTYWLPLPSAKSFTTPMDEPWFKYASVK
jgi:hypothetical protein